MDLNEFQQAANRTDQRPGRDDEAALLFPVIGLSSEIGSLVRHVKKRLRDDDAYELFSAEMADELGDVLWYVANLAEKLGFELDEIAQRNLRKIRGRWPVAGETMPLLLPDDDFAEQERLPRQASVRFVETQEPDNKTAVRLYDGDGNQVGDRLTDNAYVDDGYRFHDAFHLTYAALLGWSPIARYFFGRRRDSAPKVREVEDAGRAIAIEEAISAFVFTYARDVRYLQRLPVATFATQRGALPHADEEDEPTDLVSVFLAPEKPLPGGEVETSARGQVLDAIIDYGGELLVVVENKIAEAGDFQARNLNVTGARVRIAEGQEAVVVLWRDVLEVFIALRERALVAGAEDGVLDHFLTYVEDHFPAVGPYRTLALCAGNPFRQRRRLRQILGEAVHGEATIRSERVRVATPAAAVIGRDAYLDVDDDGAGITLSLYPADTLTQAKEFYKRPDAIEGLSELRGQGWAAKPNFHFGHVERGYCWTCNKTDIDDYVGLWTERIINGEGKVPDEKWETYWDWLEREQIACPEDKPEFNRHFVDTDRTTATPRPGIWLYRRWPLDEAVKRDSGGALAGEVREALDSALTACGEPPLPEAV